jgi:type VI secretion system secreted protein VgrG
MPQQDKFPVRIQAPAAAGDLLFEQASCIERCNEPYTFQVTVLSEKQDLQADKVLGEPVTLLIELPGQQVRPMHGLVSRFVQTGEQIFSGERERKPLYRYQLRLQPWFWFLTRAADCRIFQKKSVPDIFEAVCKEHGFHDYKLTLNATYQPRDYCVQYRETDFNFLSRLLEEVGIHYFFDHHEDRHVMVLADGPDAHQPAAAFDKVEMRPDGAARATEGMLESWWVEHSVQSGAYATTDYNFETPSLSLLKSALKSRTYAKSDLELFDYPASPDVLNADGVTKVANVRLQEVQAGYERFHGSSAHCAGLRNGAKFELQKHPNKSLNKAYIIIGTTHTFTANQYTAGGDNSYSAAVAVEAIDSKAPYRPVRSTPKPVIQGTQTAVVVGQKGNEIDTDKYGRVKVQFRWDREGKLDENSSCWVRVAQVWAGKSWGALHIPRVGQEVLVSFLEGDPDQPIITGRVYNAEFMPPYALPDNRTQSGIMSRSSPNGAAANCNEIRFEDKKGEELLTFHAEKDLTTEVEHDQTVKVGNDTTITIDHDRTATVKNDETCTVNGNRTAKVDKNENLTVTQDQTSDVKQNQTLKVGQTYKLTAGQEIHLEVGQAKLVMKADGTIELSGLDIKIDGSSSIKQSGGMKIELSTTQYKLAGTVVQVQGTQTSIQGTLLDLQASAVASLKGALTQIG